VRRLLVVNKAYWPHLGGVETVARQLAEGAAEAGFEVDVLCLADKGAEEEINGVRVHRVRTAFRVGSAPLAWRFLERYRRMASQADVIHFHAPNPMGELALLWRGRGSAQKVVCTYHSDPLRPKWAAGAYQRLLRAFLDRCDAIVATSPNYIQSSPVLKPIENRCTFIPLGVDVERFSKVNPDTIARCEKMLEGLTRPRVLFVGRLVYYKGVDVLLRALSRVPEVSAVIVGDGPLKRDLTGLAEKLGIATRVRFLDPLPDVLYPAIYHCADLFVLPSVERTEAFGIVGLEAMAAELPLITTELGTGTSFYNKDGVVGLVVEAGNAKSLSEAILKISIGFGAFRETRQKDSTQEPQLDLGEMTREYLGLFGKTCEEQKAGVLRNE
jgi:rhamnosyl/mannosyltransferase